MFIHFTICACIRVHDGLENNNKKFSAEDRRRTAIHEAGKLPNTLLMLHAFLSIYDT
jgi:hypothetical protein